MLIGLPRPGLLFFQENSMNDVVKTDALIIGAGPVGLFAVREADL